MFGKEQFVGKVTGSLSEHYTIIKVKLGFTFRKLDQEATAVFSKSRTKQPERREPVSN
jgi:hypothetical protein